MNDQRYHRFAIVTYNEEKDIQLLIQNAFKYAYIIHDKDKTDVHIHILTSFKGNKSYNAVKKLISGNHNTFVQELIDPQAAYIYLTHEDSPDKALYNEDDIKTNDRDYFKGKQTINPNEEFVHDLLDNNLNMRQMAMKYGRDYIRFYSSYQFFKESYNKQLSECVERINRIAKSKIDMTDVEGVQLLDQLVAEYEALKGEASD